MPSITSEDKVINTVTQLKKELASTPTTNKCNQLESLTNLRTLFSKHSKAVSPSHVSQDNKNEREHSSTIGTNNSSPRKLCNKEKSTDPSTRVNTNELDAIIFLNPKLSETNSK